jgi:orotidine-5'-phosphate decarboxylase
MTLDLTSAAPRASAAPVPIVALDVPGAREALALVERLPGAEWVKVGLQLFTAAGPDIVRALRERGRRVFLDLKFHDIPNTVARAVESAAGLGVDLLTLHASGGSAMMRAARRAAGAPGQGPALYAVTMLTSLSEPELAEAWGRDAVRADEEVIRLATLARDVAMDGVVASVHELPAIHERVGGLRVLTPGIRLAGDDAGDQARVATPARAARLGADYLVIGRSVTAAPDPAAAFQRLLGELRGERE